MSSLHKIIFNKSKSLSRQNLYEFFGEIIGTDSKEKALLNIGSGGAISEIISCYDFTSSISIDVDANRNPDVVMDACSLRFPDNSFDIVCAIEVLEHIPTPQAAVDEIYRVLKPSGKFIMSTPFVFGIHDEPYDYYRYTRYGLEYLLRGFESVHVRERNSYFSTIVVLLSRLIMSKNKTDRVLGAAFTALSALLSPVIWVLNSLISSRNITTGYFLTATK
ncbi:MAG: class I SAM-dependent methyltransferase [Cyanobacteria bacterium J06581_3]